MATLEEILQARDERQARQREILRENPGKTLLCLTVVMPGSVKRNRQSLIVANAALDALTSQFGSSGLQKRDLQTGFEAYLLTSLPAVEAKRAVCRIEQEHPLGRLFDIDVIGQDGVPLQRADIGLEPRKCLLCDQPARWCMRGHTHSTEEILARIDEMVNAYV
ncbi:MAG: citrate lyase holo-[Bacteroidales bacterium]|nr:citrate lyase holo-[acyl-carrier protein] synthase [Bacteroidales bacterium]